MATCKVKGCPEPLHYQGDWGAVTDNGLFPTEGTEDELEMGYANARLMILTPAIAHALAGLVKVARPFLRCDDGLRGVCEEHEYEFQAALAAAEKALNG